MTRSSSRKMTPCHPCHVLNFFYDDDDGCALTVFTHGVRFHIIADAERLRAKAETGRNIEDEYKRLLTAVQKEAEADEVGQTNPDKFQRKMEMEAAEMHCGDDQSNNSQDSGHGTDEDRKGDEHDEDDDSAVDVSEQSYKAKDIGVRDSGIVLGEYCAPESEKAIQNWMLSPFTQIFEELAPASKAPKNPTLEEWYHGTSYFYNLEIEDGQLSASQEEATEALKKRIADLVPRMPIPKYIKDLGIPLVQAKDITVVEEGTEPEPYHPTRVKVNGETQFLKMVDMSQYQPTKREIKLLKEVEKKKLHKKFRVPRVLGLVYETLKSEIMGFLQTDIEEPTPLTRMLDSDVVEENREKWADESERIIELLHENDIIWGDAKADNFMVDKHGDLWIIDFGGSYTDGWIDPELMETKEGDDMGTDKIINALKDPESNTYDPTEEATREQSIDEPQSSTKRPRSDDDDEDEDENGCVQKLDRSAKRRR